MAASELADWWDTQMKESQTALEEWVQDNPQWWSVGLATAGATAMHLGAGMVDALRLGEGVARGEPGQDILRLLVVVGPVARGVAAIGRVAHTQTIRLALTTNGITGPCTFTAVNNAMSIVGGWGRNLFLTAKDAARALNQPLNAFAQVGKRYKVAAWINELVPFLARQGVRLRALGSPRSIEDVIRVAQSQNGVVVFAIEWTDMMGKLHRHSMIAVRTLGGVRFADYGGKFISSLSELANRGGTWVARSGFSMARAAGRDGAVLFEGMNVIGALDGHAGTVFEGGMLLIEGMHAVETQEGVDLAFPVVTAAAIEPGAHEPEVLKASFEAFKARKLGEPVPKLKPVALRGRRHAPPSVEQLTGVQYRLNALGFGAGAVDGTYGPRSKKAVTEFQRTYGLKTDGIPGPKVQAKLALTCGF